MDKPYDKSSAFLFDHFGGSILRLARVTRVRRWESQRTVLVQPSQLPDGVLKVELEDRLQPVYFVGEIATYPDQRNKEQMLRGSLLVLLDRRQLPEMLTIVLRPRSNVPVSNTETYHSVLGFTELKLTWRVVELWNVPAEELLAANDVGVIPWVPLTQFDGPPEELLRQCRERIDQQAPPHLHENLLAVTQVMTMLRYNDPQLLSIIGGRQAMIESPLIQEIVAERRHKDVLLVLTDRFGVLPLEIKTALQCIQDEPKLDELLIWAYRCPDLDAFRTRLPA